MAKATKPATVVKAARPTALQTSQPLTDEEILELSGEAALEDVRGLTLRGRSLTTFDSHAGRLPSLEALSLSGNQLTSLASFTALTSLRTLNVNSNQLTSLTGLQACQALQQLYAGANKLRDIQALAGLPYLSTLHLFSNAISALDLTAQVLVTLPSLTDLDLGANPAAVVPSYKAHLVLRLPGLQTLDGDTLTDLDRTLAAEQAAADQWGPASGSHAAQVLTLEQSPAADSVDEDGAGGTAETGQHNRHQAFPQPQCQGGADTGSGPRQEAATQQQPEPGAGLKSNGNGPQTQQVQSSAAAVALPWAGSSGTSAAPMPVLRPGTAASAAGMRPSTAAGLAPAWGIQGWSRPGTALSGVGPVSGSDATAGSLPEGWGTDSTGPGPGTAGAYTSHLLSDQLLNDHPLVLEYLAKHVLAKGTAAVQGKEAMCDQQAAGDVMAPPPLPGRGSFAQRLRNTASACSATEGLDPQQLAAAAKAAPPSAGPVPGAGPQVLAPGAAAAQALSGATPEELIRQLIRLVEVLIKELNIAKQAAATSAGTKAGPSSSSSSSNHSSHRPASATKAGSRPASGEGRVGTPPRHPAGQASGGAEAGSSKQAGVRAASPAGESGVAGSSAPAASEPAMGSITDGVAQQVQGSKASNTGSQTGAAGGSTTTGATSTGAGDGVADGGGGGGSNAIAGASDAEQELIRLRREVKTLAAENANIYWLADECKRLRAEVAQLKAQQGQARG